MTAVSVCLRHGEIRLSSAITVGLLEYVRLCTNSCTHLVLLLKRRQESDALLEAISGMLPSLSLWDALWHRRLRLSD